MISLLTCYGITDLLNNKDIQHDFRIHLISLQQDINFETCLNAKSLKTAISQHGKNLVGKLIAAAIIHFCLSLNLKRPPQPHDIIESAQLIIENWGYESFTDILLALKRAKLQGTTYYGSIGVNQLMDILNQYFDAKSIWLENRRYQQKQTEDCKGFFDIKCHPAIGDNNRKQLAQKLYEKLKPVQQKIEAKKATKN